MTTVPAADSPPHWSPLGGTNYVPTVQFQFTCSRLIAYCIPSRTYFHFHPIGNLQKNLPPCANYRPSANLCDSPNGCLISLPSARNAYQHPSNNSPNRPTRWQQMKFSIGHSLVFIRQFHSLCTYYACIPGLSDTTKLLMSLDFQSRGGWKTSVQPYRHTERGWKFFHS